MTRDRSPTRCRSAAVLTLVVVLAAVLRPAAQTGTEASAEDAGLATIATDDLREHIGYLASDRLKGRAAGTRGNDLAAAYIAKQFARIGLQRVARNGHSWFQPFEAHSQRYKTVDTKNVLGLLPGTDPQLKDEVLVLGAHFDHVGVGKFGSRETGRSGLEDKIHNGADDNASGTAGILELAEAFAKAPPRRSLLFLAFSAEELGLLGSEHYCEEPELPLQQTVAMFNFDMIGRSVDDYLFVGGTGTSPVWSKLLDEYLDGAGLRVERGAGGHAPSDNTAFYDHGLPVLFFFTNVHADYHRVSDEAEFINYGGERKILRATYRLVRAIADRDSRPPFAKSDGTALPQSMQRLMQLPSRARNLAGQARERARARIDRKGCGRLGFSPGAGREGELLISELLAAGPAAKAGLDVGDVILAVAGEPVTHSRDVAKALKGKKTGERVALSVRRDGKTDEVTVTVGR